MDLMALLGNSLQKTVYEMRNCFYGISFQRQKHRIGNWEPKKVSCKNKAHRRGVSPYSGRKEKSEITIQNVPTSKRADTLTKALPGKNMKHWHENLLA